MALGWLNWALALVSLLVAALMVWHVAWAIADGSGSGRDSGLSVVGEGRSETRAGSEGSAGESQPGARRAEPEGQGASGGQEVRSEGAPAAQRVRALPLADYNTKLRTDLFGLGSGIEPARTPAATGPSPADLQLQGVILGEPPQAIIYDTRRGTTHWVTLGERIGEITIEKIDENTVVISFGGESLDLRL